LKNNFLLIDITGKPTTWGRWSPEYVNDDPLWYDEQGLNSLQILSWLLSAYRITGDDMFITAYNVRETRLSLLSFFLSFQWLSLSFTSQIISLTSTASLLT
jgi:hypothetical protein